MEDGKTTSSTYQIDKLNETNYRSWSRQIEDILDEKDLLEIVEGTEKRPIPNPPMNHCMISMNKSVNHCVLQIQFAISLSDFVFSILIGHHASSRKFFV
jgi:hypothetical protein